MNMKQRILYNLSIKLKNLRVNKNLTQTELANFLNVKRTTYTNWEVGRTEIPIEMLNKIAIYYNINMDYLLCLDKRKNIKTYNKDLNFNIFAINLKKYLKDNNLKIEALAIDANTTISTIWAYLHNKEKIRTCYLYLICLNNKLSVDKLFERF